MPMREPGSFPESIRRATVRGDVSSISAAWPVVRRTSSADSLVLGATARKKLDVARGLQSIREREGTRKRRAERGGITMSTATKEELDERYSRLRASSLDRERVLKRARKQLPKQWSQAYVVYPKSRQLTIGGTCDRCGDHFSYNLPKGHALPARVMCKLLALDFAAAGWEVERETVCPECASKGIRWTETRVKYYLRVKAPWMDEPKTIAFDESAGQYYRNEIVACVAFLLGAETYQDIADDARLDAEGVWPEQVDEALERYLGVAAIRHSADAVPAVAPDVRPLSKEELDQRLAALEAVGDSYTPESIFACCYSPVMSRDLRKSLECCECGERFPVSHVGTQLHIDKYDEIAASFARLGYTARVDVFCPRCALKHGKASSYEFVFTRSNGTEVRTPLLSDLMTLSVGKQCASTVELKTALAFLADNPDWSSIVEATDSDTFGDPHHKTVEGYGDEIRRILGIGVPA